MTQVGAKPISPLTHVTRRSFFSISEASANSLTHVLGLVAALVGAPVLVVLALRVGTPEQAGACAVYGLTLILLFAASTHYHVRQDKPGDYRRLITDHICIYLLIAGTYTPICFTTLRGPWGWALFAAIWTLATLGIAFKCAYGLRFERLSLALYLVMGWLSVFALSSLVRNAGAGALALILGGGVVYTVGTLFYTRVWIGKIRYSHAVWHLAVVAGSTLHYFAVRECVLNAELGTRSAETARQ
jgi:hemolysin III